VTANVFDEDRNIYIFVAEVLGFTVQIDDKLFGS